MTTPLLATKWFAPPVRSDAVRRPRLVQRVERGIADGHVVLAAPAGFGKSTLAAQWRESTPIPTAWLSLHEDDREPIRFLSYLVAALRSVEPGLAESVVRSLNSARPEPPEAITTELVNALAAGRDEVALVLDDYHRADGPAIRDVVTLLIDHAPPRFHLVFTTRDEPDLPLARLRARGRLTEIDSDGLRFEAEESTHFLSGAMGLDLSADDADALRTTTEGWAAGLQLAALSLRGRDDPHAFVHAFAGRNRHVLDYLSSEVLRGVDERVRRFLLDVAVLDRLSAPLCDAVTGRDEGAEMLERLDRANLFLVRLDDERRWYRFHALFADVLRAEATTALGSALQERHRRASAWFETHGESGDAIEQARAAGDDDRAVRLLERAWRPMDRNFQMPTWHRWASRFPEESLTARPVLAVALAWERLGAGNLAGCAALLARAEAWIGARADEAPEEARQAFERHVADAAAYRALPARIAAARSYAAQATGDVAAGERHARQAVDLAPDDDPGAWALPAGLLGLSAWARGDLDRAHADLTVGMRGFRDLGDAGAALSFAFGLADVDLARGRLRAAIGSYEQALRYAGRQPGPTLPGEAEARIGLAECLAERGDLGEAEVELRAGEALGSAGILTGDDARLIAVRARLEFALGNAELALALLDESDTLEVAGPVPTIHPTGATRARIWLAQGRLAEARSWAAAYGPPSDLEPSYVDDQAHLTIARVLLASYRSDGDAAAIEEARTLLERLVTSALDAGRIGTIIEARVVQALVHQALGDEDASTSALLEALRLAEPEGHVSVFVTEGPVMASLLRAAGRAGAGKRHLRRLLAALDASAARPQVLPDHVEALSDRERDVLRLLQGDMSGPQVARELGMSVHTLRSHTKSIYAKLDVHGRKAAVRRGEELGLL